MHGGFSHFPREQVEAFPAVENAAGDKTDFHADEIFVVFLLLSQVGLVIFGEQGLFRIQYVNMRRLEARIQTDIISYCSRKTRSGG